jgi:hypothetical protein
LPQHLLAQLAPEMEQKATPGWYNNPTGQFTPPNSSGGLSPDNSPFGGMGGFPTAQQARYMDNNVVERQRSSSIGSRGSPVGNYDFAHMDTVPRWRDDGLVGVPGSNPTAYSLVM